MPLHKDKEEEKKGNGETILKVDCALLYKIDINPGNRASFTRNHYHFYFAVIEVKCS